MKQKIFISILVSLITTLSFGQELEYFNAIGKFKGASSFFITVNGTIYITDSETDELISIDTIGTVLESIGGYGWATSAFDQPVDVYATTLNVYVADKYNHRIQQFDRKLNFISSLSTKETDNPDARFAYPIGCSASSQGDLYIIDSENNRVVKFDLFGSFVQNFGGFEAGNFELEKPKSIAIDSYQNIYILDGNSFIIFDQYGNGLERISFEDDLISIRILFNRLTINSKTKVYNVDLRKKNFEFTQFTIPELKTPLEIISSMIYNDKLYVLTKSNIIVFNILQ